MSWFDDLFSNKENSDEELLRRKSKRRNGDLTQNKDDSLLPENNDIYDRPEVSFVSLSMWVKTRIMKKQFIVTVMMILVVIDHILVMTIVHMIHLITKVIQINLIIMLSMIVQKIQEDDVEEII